MIPTKAHAVLIGVDDYSTYDPANTHNLLGCVNDVRAFWDVCVTSGFAPENIHVLTKPALDPAEVGGLAANFKEATRENILAEQKVLVDLLAADPRAVGVLVYSGHGAWIDNASEDSAIICPSDFAIDLARPVNDIPVHNLWKGGGSNLTVILDCCHSGGRSGHVTMPATTPRDPHRKHLPTHLAKASAPHVDAPIVPGNVSQFKQGSPDQSPPPKEFNLEAFKPLHFEDLARKGMLPIGSQMPLTLTTRTLTEHDLKFSPYRNAEHTMRGAKVLAACDVHEAAYQAEFAGRFHGAFTWAVTSTVGQWKVEEAADGAIRTDDRLWLGAAPRGGPAQGVHLQADSDGPPAERGTPAVLRPRRDAERDADGGYLPGRGGSRPEEPQAHPDEQQQPARLAVEDRDPARRRVLVARLRLHARARGRFRREPHRCGVPGHLLRPGDPDEPGNDVQNADRGLVGHSGQRPGDPGVLRDDGQRALRRRHRVPPRHERQSRARHEHRLVPGRYGLAAAHVRSRLPRSKFQLRDHDAHAP